MSFESLQRELTERVRNIEYNARTPEEKTFALLGKQILNLNEKLESQNKDLVKRIEKIEKSQSSTGTKTTKRATRKATRR